MLNLEETREQREITRGCMSVGQLAFPSSECQLALKLLEYSSFPPFPLLPLAFAAFFYYFFLQGLLLWLFQLFHAPPGCYGLC